MKMKIDIIGNIISEIKTGKTPPTKNPEYFGNQINWYTPTDLDKEKYLDKSLRQITKLAIDERKAVLFKPNSILIGCIGDIGKVGITKDYSSSNQQITGLLTNEKVLPEYLYYWVKKNRALLKSKSANAILPILNNKQLASIKIEFPEKLEDQLRIANILSRAESLITKRKESIQLLDELLKSTFLDMFGDPVRNEKGWEKETLDNLVAKDCPLTYGIVQPGEEFTDGVPVVRPIDLTQTYVDIDGLKRINPKISEKFSRTILRGNEILMCVRGVTGIISRSTENLKGCNVTRGITPIWFDEHYNLLFAFNLLQSKAVNNEIQKLTYGATLRQINLRDLRKLELINPPILKQNEFAQIVEKVEIIKTKYQESLQELENLYASLSQKAFKGELDLSKMEIKDYYLGHAEPEDPDSYREAAEDGAEYNKQL